MRVGRWHELASEYESDVLGNESVISKLDCFVVFGERMLVVLRFGCVNCLLNSLDFGMNKSVWMSILNVFYA